jgi:glycosyltransferase involved in cell wall biosynthesis
MAQERKRIGFLFTSIGRESMGVLNYFISIIKAVDTLPDDQKPTFVVIYDEHISKWVEQINYPYLELKLVPRKGVLKSFLLSTLTGKNHFVGDIIDEFNLDGVYPMNDHVGKIRHKRKCKIVSWYPDFQHKFYPQYFKKTNLAIKEWRLKQMISKADHLVLSSHNAVSHLNRFYRIPARLNVHVLQFVSMLSHYQLPAFDEVKNRYGITGPYFLLANQFYKHKNHLLAFKAMKLVQSKGINIQMVCTGKLEDYRNPEYIEEVKNFIADNNLHDDIKLLGIIPREDQLALMKNSLAVLQPSKFEGWSTVIEDAKTLRLPVLASTFPVHHEQLGEKGLYFEENDPVALANLIEGLVSGSVKTPPAFNNHKDRIAAFANGFIQLFQ